ncbi:Uncharacterized protein TCM_002592 [Theobroma cacao]|uniref:Reverse transcriptase zinc-binding domain-containing protein n=1 Tax=Theobroma cacao TaxID=3641 RepID=A0A061DM00_THECC|nr:Uncharacterized protein TCM_002592 [Theobroma cacao]
MLLSSAFMDQSTVWRKVRLGYTPYRIELFVWQLMWEKVAMKDELARRGLLEEDETLCVLCWWKFNMDWAHSSGSGQAGIRVCSS